MVMEGANGETPANLMVNPVTISDEGNSGNKKGKRKAEGTCSAKVDLENMHLNIVESGKRGKKSNNGNEIAGSKGLEVNHRGGDDIKGANSLKKKQLEDGSLLVAFPVGLRKKTTSGSEEGKPGKKRNNNEATWKMDSAALHLSFSQGISLPSRENLISEFSKYGPLIESDIEVIRESSSARVVFLRYTDAEKAFNDKAGAFGPPVASHRIQYLTGNPKYPPVEAPVPPIPRPPLPYIRKNLERMISQLHGTSPLQNVAGTSGGLTPAIANLVGDMQALLTKVNQILGGPDAGTST